MTATSTLRVLGVAVVLLALPGCTTAPVTPSRSASAAATPTLDRWQPTGTMGWHIQYQGEVGTPDVAVLNLDGVETPASQVDALHATGARAVCYLNAGGSEDFRDDFVSLPASVQGNPLDAWPGERWLDVRQLDVLLPVMALRMDQCRDKGFDGVDPDNLNGFAHDTGFPLTLADALGYQRALVTLAHDRGLAIGLKNTMELIPELADEVDFAVNEQCQEFDECDTYAPLVALGKPVFNVEYRGTCAGQPAGLSTVLADPALDGPTTTCR
ncbi:MAG: endo alpha-1,4 polygalactosaminidase [Arachnia sp.]